MLLGNIKCEDVKNVLIKYINFEMTKNDMLRVAKHIRNCPDCKEKYMTLQNKKKKLKIKFEKIQKRIKIEEEISAYMDNEIDETERLRMEGMILTRKKHIHNYRRIFPTDDIFYHDQ